ncbi:hypothetical protein B0H13DRAFT_2364865 [Mycena leptocephala]|nr:hypothetical protein B0H13DRAFT_2364865 [Mycena leptocephala]
MGAAMMARDDPKSEPSVLVFNTAWAGPFRVNLVHAIPPEGETEIAWRLDTPEPSTMMVERNVSDVTFQENSFTIQVAEPGVHQLSITFTRPTWHERRYALRKVWVSGEEAIENESDDTEEDSEKDESEQEEGNVNEGESEGDEGEGSDTEGEELEVVDDIDSESI